MNINHQLFKSITDNLNIVLDTVPAHQKTETKEYEYYAMEVAFSSLMAFYSCPDLSESGTDSGGRWRKRPERSHL